MLIKLKEVNLNPETRMITLKFLGLFGYEHVMDYIGRYIENNRERDYNLIQASSTGHDIYSTLHFYTSEAMKKFWNEHISVYGKLPSTAIYFEIPESEGIRSSNIPVRMLKLDDFEEQRQKYKKMVNQLYGVASMSITGPRRNGKSMFFPEYHYKPLKFNDEKENNKMISYIRNDFGNFEMELRMNLAPLLVRSVQINEKKGVVTIVWRDGDVTMAKCGPNDEFDVEKGVAIAFMKHWFTSTTQMNKWMREQTKEYYERTDTEEDRLSLKNLVEDFIKNAS